MKRRTMLVGSLAACSGIALAAPWILSRRTPDVTALRGPTMGTYYSVKFGEDAAGVALVQRETAQVLTHVDALMSTYRPDSELSAFNATPSTGWTEMSADTRTVIDEALRVGDLTQGAFDVTVGPLVNLWGFGATGNPLAVPDDEALADAARAVDYRLLAARGRSVRKSVPALHADLSGIAKGYAVDRLAALLDRRGIESYLIEVGGELRAHGRKPDGLPWRVGIERPVPGARSVYRAVNLHDRAIATSGDYRNFFLHEGQRYSHTVDPRTARPVIHTLASVSVIAETAMTADAFSTAIMVLGPDAGYEFARSHDLAATLIAHRGDGFEERWTPAFERHRVS